MNVQTQKNIAQKHIAQKLRDSYIPQTLSSVDCWLV